MIRLGFDAKRMFKNNSGLGNYSRSTLDLLAKYYPEDKYFLFSGYDENRVGFTPPENAVVSMPTSFIADISPSLWRSFFMAKDIRKVKIDIFHGLSNELSSDIRNSGAKSVVTIHDLIYIRYPNLYKKADRLMYEYKYKKSCENADMVVAISQQTKSDIMEYWGIPDERISIVYQGCNPIFYNKVSDEEKQRIRDKYNLPDRYILSVGTLEERKNLMLTLNAMVEGNIDISLVACGKHTEYADKLKDYAVKNNIEERVHFHNNIDFADLPAIYQMASLAVYVSLFEGFGIPILEALNSGTPIITSSGGVFYETGGEACYYVGQYDRDDMIDTINTILSGDVDVQAKIEKGYQHAELFKEEHVANNLHKIYEKLM